LCHSSGLEHAPSIAKLEFLDETEELDLVLDHYAISWGLYLASLSDDGSSWGDWGLKQKGGIKLGVTQDSILT
jgi:[phosphatase 2A protein]-leucine-carboxy methyltransferase